MPDQSEAPDMRDGTAGPAAEYERYKQRLRAGLEETWEGSQAHLKSLIDWHDQHPEEVRACALLLDVLNIPEVHRDRTFGYERRDQGGGAQAARHDFDLIKKNGDRIAVEVTRHLYPAAEAFENRIQPQPCCSSSRQPVFPLRSERVKQGWRIEVLPPPEPEDHKAARAAVQERIEALTAEIPSLLAEAEALAEDSPRHPSTPDGAPASDAYRRRIAVRNRLQELGVRQAYPHSHTEAGHISAVVAGPIGLTGPSDIADTVKRHLTAAGKQADNRKKLAEAKQPGRDRRAVEAHLFIWVYVRAHGSHAAAAGLTDAIEILGPVPPANRYDVDVVWVAPDAAWCAPNCINDVIDKKSYNAMHRRPDYPIYRLDGHGWQKFECRWRGRRLQPSRRTTTAKAG